MDRNASLLDDWNTELAIALVPNTVILALYLILGISGNTLVILVYGFRMKKQSEDRYFIPFLAVSDLSAATVCATMAIALNMLQAEFTNNDLCKALWFFAATTTYMSILLLTIIAVHRYMKVCKPLGTQMSIFWKRIAVLFAFLLAVVLGAPTAVLYGSVEFSKPDGSITGLRCSKLKNVSKLGSLLYGAVAGLVLLTTVTALIVFYGRIGYTIVKHFRKMSKQKMSNPIVDDVPSSKMSDSGTSGATFSTEMTRIRSIEVEHNTELSAGKVDSSSNLTGSESEIEQNRSKNAATIVDSEKRKRKKKNTSKSRDNEETNKTIMYRFTIMFMVITIIFLTCYVPKILLLVMEAMNPKFWQNLPSNLRAAALFGYRLYILNNVVNPLVYAFMDEKFRREAKSLLQCTKT